MKYLMVCINPSSFLTTNLLNDCRQANTYCKSTSRLPRIEQSMWLVECPVVMTLLFYWHDICLTGCSLDLFTIAQVFFFISFHCCFGKSCIVFFSHDRREMTKVVVDCMLRIANSHTVFCRNHFYWSITAGNAHCFRGRFRASTLEILILIVGCVKTEPGENKDVPAVVWWNCEDIEAIRAAYYSRQHNS